MTSTTSQSIFTRNIANEYINLHPPCDKATILPINTTSSSNVNITGTQVFENMYNRNESCAPNSAHFPDFVSNALQPLSIQPHSHLTQCSCCSNNRGERYCIQFLDKHHNTMFYWCEEDYNSLVREGILQEARKSLPITMPLVSRRNSTSHMYIQNNRLQHQQTNNFMPRSMSAMDGLTNINSNNNLATPSNLPNSSFKPIQFRSNFDANQRRASLPILQVPTPQRTCNNSEQNRRHSVSIPPKQNVMTPFPSELDESIPLCLDSLPDFGLPPLMPKKDKQKNDENEQDEKILVFDGLIRRKKGNNKPQDSYQIKFKLV